MRYFIFLINFLFYVSNEEQTKFTFECYDENCSKPLFRGRAGQRYNSNDRLKQSFHPNDYIDVYGISKNGELDYYLVKHNGEEKLFPSKMLKGRKEINKAEVDVVRHFPEKLAKNKSQKVNRDTTPVVISLEPSLKRVSSSVLKETSSSIPNSKLQLFLDIVMANSSVDITSRKGNELVKNTKHSTPRVLHGDKVGQIPEYNDYNSSVNITEPDVLEETDGVLSEKTIRGDVIVKEPKEKLVAEEDLIEDISTEAKDIEAVSFMRMNDSSDVNPLTKKILLSNDTDQGEKDEKQEVNNRTESDSNDSENVHDELVSTTGQPRNENEKINLSIEEFENSSESVKNVIKTPSNASESAETTVNNEKLLPKNLNDDINVSRTDMNHDDMISNDSSTNNRNEPIELGDSNKKIVNDIPSQTVTEDPILMETKNIHSALPSTNVHQIKLATGQNNMFSEMTDQLRKNLSSDSPVPDISENILQSSNVASKHKSDTDFTYSSIHFHEPENVNAAAENHNDAADTDHSNMDYDSQYLQEQEPGYIQRTPVYKNSEPEPNFVTPSSVEQQYSDYQTTGTPSRKYVKTISKEVKQDVTKNDELPSEQDVKSAQDPANIYDIVKSQQQATDLSSNADEKNVYERAKEYMFSIFAPWKSSTGVKYEAQQEYCSSEKECDGVIVHSMKDINIGIQDQFITIPFLGKVSNLEKEWLMPCAGVMLVTSCFCIILFMFKIGQSRRKGSNLIGIVNRLENKLLVATKEILLLQDELETSTTVVRKTSLQGNLSAEKKEAIKEAFNKQLKQYQEKNMKLEDTVSYLEKELESVSSSALEMHKLLENSLVNQSTSKATIDEVDELRTVIVKQEAEIEDLRTEMNSILIENQMLKESSESLKVTVKKMENECNIQIGKNLELSEKQKELNLRLDTELENNSAIEDQYKSEIYRLKSKIEDLEITLKTSEFQVEALNRIIGDKTCGSTDSSDYVQLKLQSSTLDAMNTELKAQLKEEKGARRMVEEHMGNVIKDLNNVKKYFEVSEKDRKEAVTKVQVLTDFFKAEVAKLQKDLEAKEKLFAENENKDQLLSQQLHLLKEEIRNQRLQNEALKKEIIEQEASYKIQLANAEQKRQEHWFAYRHSDRKYKECQQEAASLRNKILILETNLACGNPNPDNKGINGVNGNMVLPSLQFLRPIISPDAVEYSNDFEPPPPSSPLLGHSEFFIPPEPLYSPDERLPPLGSRRVSSPANSIPPDEDELTPPPPPIPSYYTNRNRNEPPYSSSYRRTQLSLNHHRQIRSRQDSNSADSVSLESLDRSGR